MIYPTRTAVTIAAVGAPITLLIALFVTEHWFAALAWPVLIGQLAIIAIPSGCAIIDDDAIDRLKMSPPLADHADTEAEAPAYMIYTSGTTNRPKGVVHAHRTALGRVPMHRDWQGLTGDDVMLHAADQHDA